MAELTAVVVALSIAVAANFVLLLAIVRRLRLQRPSQPSLSVSLPAIGMRIPTFAVEDIEGRKIDEGFCSEGEMVAAFFADDCAPCERVKAEIARDPIAGSFVAFIRTADGGARQIEFATALANTGARTVLLDPASDLPDRFTVSAYPTLMRIQGGVVVVSSVKLADVRGGSELQGRATVEDRLSERELVKQ